MLPKVPNEYGKAEETRKTVQALKHTMYNIRHITWALTPYNIWKSTWLHIQWITASVT